MNRLARCLTAAALAAGPALLPGPAAQETVRVEGEGEKTPVDLTGFVETIRADRFESRVTSLTDLLRDAVGLQVRSYGGLGSFATVSIRGSTAEQVNIYVDGVLVNPALGGGVNLADFALSNIDSIEIYRGFTPSFLGSGAIGGAINIRTKRPAAGRSSGSGSLSYGAYGTGEAAGLLSWSRPEGARSAADGLVSLDVTRSDGDYRFYDTNGTLQTAGDDGFETRLNNAFRLADLLGRAGFDLSGGGRFETEATFTSRRAGVPGIDAFQSLDARAEMTRTMGRVSFTQDHLAANRLRLELYAYYSRTWQQFADPSGGTTGGFSADTRGIMDAAGPTALLRWRSGPAAGIGHEVSLLVSARRETAQRTEWTNPDPDRGHATRLGWTATLADEIHFAGGRLVVTPSARLERFSNHFVAPPGVAPPATARGGASLLAGRVGVAWRPGTHLAVRANAGKFYRVPNFTELFGDQGTVSGSPDLSPEVGWNYDLGASWETERHGVLDRAHVETSVFRRDADNLIQFVQTSQSHVVARNIEGALVTGAELSAAIGLFGCLDGDLNYTWQVATDRSGTFLSGSDLPGRPRHEASARAALAKSWGRPFYEFSYVGANFFDPAASAVSGSRVSRDLIRVPGRYFHNVGFTRSLGPRLEMTFEVDNVLNVKTVDVVRYPLPGRLFATKIRVALP